MTHPWCRGLQSLGLVALFPLLSSAALAADDDPFADDASDDDDEDDSKTAPTKNDDEDADLKKTLDDTESPDDDDEIPMGPAPEPGVDFKNTDEDDEDAGDGVQQEGGDTAAIYRAKIDEMKGWAADEEAMEWEEYLKTYPTSMFRSRIEARMDELGDRMFDQHITGSTAGTGDAGRTELLFSTPIQLESLDPRDKLRLGFEWGFPEHISFIADYEAQLLRELSIHGGLHQRYTGMNAEIGARYALVKSARTHTLVTGIADVHYNFDPSFPGFRPQIGAGQRVDVLEGLDLQVEAGTDLLFAPSGVSPRIVGGLNASLHANDEVTVFMETSTYMKDMFDPDLEGGGFRFNVVTFGISFVAMKGHDDGKGVGIAKIAATSPYSNNYWGYHSGAVDADFNYFL